MLKDKSEIIKLVYSIAQTFQSLKNLPPDVAHYTCDEKRIEIAQSCLLLAVRALKDDNDSSFLRYLMTDVLKQIDELAALNC